MFPSNGDGLVKGWSTASNRGLVPTSSTCRRVLTNPYIQSTQSTHKTRSYIRLNMLSAVLDIHWVRISWKEKLFCQPVANQLFAIFGNFGYFWEILSPLGIWSLWQTSGCLDRGPIFISKLSKAQGIRELSASALKVTASTTTTRLDLMSWPINCDLSPNCAKLLPNC